MIHATRPFVVNEWIQTKIEGYEVSGTVEVCIQAFKIHPLDKVASERKDIVHNILVKRRYIMRNFLG